VRQRGSRSCLRRWVGGGWRRTSSWSSRQCAQWC
jgi:hypothetical protein